MGKDKLKRFAEVETFNNVIQPDEIAFKQNHSLKGKWHTKFNNDNPIVLELGCGKGEYTVGLAQLKKDVNFIGVDIKGSRIWKGAKTCIEMNIKNVQFLRTKVDFINNFFAPEEVSEIWLTFSDPQPKKPRKRLTSPLFIDRYSQILRKNGIINLKTDSDLLYEYTIDEINKNGYKIHENSADIYNDFVSEFSFEKQKILNIRTFYESKWLKKEKKIKYISFSGFN